jgi:dihydrofolate reductase
MAASRALTTTPSSRWESAATDSSPGSVTVTPPALLPGFKMSAVSAAFFDEGASRVGAVIAGRRTYDISEAWGGNGPLPGIPLFVLTHHVPDTVPAGDPPYTFVTDGIEGAVEQARTAAAGKDVVLMGASIVRQGLRAGLLDELVISLVPVVLGRGARPLDGLEPGSVQFDLVRVVDAPGVTHLTYRVLNNPIQARSSPRSATVPG